MGLLTYLTYEGIWMDFGKHFGLVAKEQRQIHAAFPRIEWVRHFAEKVLAHGARSETAAPPMRSPTTWRVSGRHMESPPWSVT